MRGIYLGGYPWRDTGILTAADLNAAIALALSPVSIIEPGSITNVMLANPYVTIGTTRVNLGATVQSLGGVLDPVNSLDVANKHYVDQFIGAGEGGGGINDAPADGNTYGRLNAAWAQVVPASGGTFTGPVGVNGVLTASGGLTVASSMTVGTDAANVDIGLHGRFYEVSTGAPSLPNNSGTTQATGLRLRLSDAGGPCLDIGSNSVSGMWIETTNAGNLGIHYPLLLNPLGGDVRTGGNLVVGGTAISLNGATSGGPHFYADNDNMSWQLGPGAGAYEWYSKTGVQLMALSPGGSLFLSGSQIFFNGAATGGPTFYMDGTNALIRPGSGNGALFFQDSSGTNQAYINFANGIGSFNGGVYGGGFYINGTDHVIYNAAPGQLTFRVGPTGGPDAYFSMYNTGIFSAQALQTGAYLFLNNRTGVVNSTGGPLIYADDGNFVLKLGSGNQGFLFQDYTGVNRGGINSAGTLVLNGVSIATGNSSYVNIYDASGNQALILGNTDRTNYYRNQTHNFQTTAGSQQLASITTGGLLLQTGNLNVVNNGVFGASVTSNGSGAAFVYADRSGGSYASWTLYANGGVTWLFNGANRFGVDASGNVSVQGNLGTGGGIQSNGAGNTALYTPNGGITTNGVYCTGVNAGNGGITAGAIGANTCQLNGGGTNVLYIPNGGINVSSVYVTQNVPNAIHSAGGCQLDGGGTNVLSVTNGGISVAGESHFYGLGNILNIDNGAVVAGLGFQSNTTGTNTSFYAPNAGGSAVFYAGNGGMTATGFNVASDARLKERIAESDIGLDAILALSPKTFTRTASPDREELGLIAQEVQEVLARAVVTIEHEDQEPHLGIDYAPITAALINAVKQLAARVAELEAR